MSWRPRQQSLLCHPIWAICQPLRKVSRILSISIAVFWQWRQAIAPARRQNRQEERSSAELHLAKEHRDRQAAIAREKYLNSLKGKSEETWTAVETFVAARQPKSYDLAVQRLIDIRDLATREGNQAMFTRRFDRLRDEHSSQKSLIDRLARAGL